MKIFMNLNFKNERLPKVTGLGRSAIRPSKPIQLVNPAVSIRSNPRLMANLRQFDPVDSVKISAANRARLTELLDAVNAQIEGSTQFKNIRFGHHEESGRSFAVVRDRETGAILKKIPSDAFLELSARLKDASGLLVDVMG